MGHPTSYLLPARLRPDTAGPLADEGVRPTCASLQVPGQRQKQVPPFGRNDKVLFGRNDKVLFGRNDKTGGWAILHMGLSPPRAYPFTGLSQNDAARAEVFGSRGLGRRLVPIFRQSASSRIDAGYLHTHINVHTFLCMEMFLQEHFYKLELCS